VTLRAAIHRVLRLSAGLAVLALFSVEGQVAIEPRAQPASKESSTTRPTLRVDTTLVLVPVTVTDGLSRPITGLEKQNFKVLDDKIPQTITQFAMEDDPVAVGFVFDVSGSMGGGLSAARRAAMEFFRSRDPKDEYFLVEFASTAKLVVPLTQDTEGIAEQLLFSKSGGSTAFLDAVYMALQEMKKAKNSKRALVIISDGGDNNSRYSEYEVKKVLRESDVLIYSVGVGGDWDGAQLMTNIAKQTGGLYLPAGAGEFRDIASKIIIDLRNRYVLGYAPTDQKRDGRYHRVQVQVIPPRGLPPLRAHWRLGYFAPE
jgi:Ca-activated chloride channel homolog